MIDVKHAYDVVIIGGGVTGPAVASFLTANADFKGSLLVIERGSTYQKSAT